MKNYSGTSFNGCSFVGELAPAVSRGGNKRRVAEWKCQCGKAFVASIGNVTSGQVLSCGCKKREAVLKRCTKHGESPISGGTRLYRFWQSMKDRCLNPKSTAYKHYGGRGITMHSGWVDSFESFKAWFIAHFGIAEIPESLSMDRTRNGIGYFPGNLRLATLKMQANNRRNNRIVEWKGQKITLTQLAEAVGVKPGTLAARLKKGTTLQEAIL